MLSPGSITNSVPDPDEAVRLQRDVQRTAQENISSVAGSFDTTFEQLQSQLATVSPHAITPVITPTPTILSATVTVPPYATSCGYSTFASGSGLNTTGSAGFLTVQITVDFGSYHSYSYQSQSNVAPGNVANVTIPQVDTIHFPAGGGTITLTASIYNGAGSWTNTAYNSIWPAGLFVFQR